MIEFSKLGNNSFTSDMVYCYTDTQETWKRKVMENLHMTQKFRLMG